MGRTGNQIDDSNTDLSGTELDLLGPDYNYSDQIRSPIELSMSSRGTFPQIADNIGGLMSYVKLLVTGRSRASKTGEPLGTKFFLETPVECKDKITGENVKRSIYINNVPDGQIPFISEGLGGSGFSEFGGLVPGVMSNIAQIHPLQILQSFTGGVNNDCVSVKLETIDSENVKDVAMGYITDKDLEVMNPAWFTYNSKDSYMRIKPKKEEGFTGMYKDKNELTLDYSQMPKDLLIKFYFTALGLLGLYIFLKTFIRRK